MTTPDPTASADPSGDAAPPAASPGRAWVRGVPLGLATAVAALGSAELVAGLARSFRSPITQVGNRVVDAVPAWLKTFAIEHFGTNDKTVLVGSVLVLLLIFAALLGVLSRRHLGLATAGIALFGVIGLAAAIAGVAGFWAGVPAIVGGIVGVVCLRALASRTWGRLAGGSRRPASPGEYAAGAPVRPSRRTFLTAAGSVAVIGGLAAAGGRALRSRFDAAVDRAKVVLPKAKQPLPPLDLAKYQADAPGATPFVTPNKTFYRIDTALDTPQVAIDGWTLTVKGMVDDTLTFTYDELLARDLVEIDMTLTCVSNEVGGILAGNARWLGVPLRQLLKEAGVQSKADQIVGRSVDGYTCGFPTAALDDSRSALVAVGMNGVPLPVEHGFPARLLVAGLYGYISATKWLSEIELTRFDQFQQYWVPRGYADRAPIKTFSRIDTPKPLTNTPAGKVAIAGVAWAQTRGISKVEVKVDDGAWQTSKLLAAPNTETWREWMLPTELTSGRHTITCRATDGTGKTQTEQRAKPLPDGATGWHSVVVLVS